MCLRSYETISIPKGEKGFKLANKLVSQGMPDGFYTKVKPVEAQQLKNNFAWESFSVSWMPMTLIACQVAVQFEPSLKELLSKFNDLIVEMCALGATACRKRESKTWRKLVSVNWKKGKRIFFSKAGGVPIQS